MGSEFSVEARFMFEREYGRNGEENEGEEGGLCLNESMDETEKRRRERRVAYVLGSQTRAGGGGSLTHHAISAGPIVGSSEKEVPKYPKLRPYQSLTFNPLRFCCSHVALFCQSEHVVTRRGYLRFRSNRRTASCSSKPPVTWRSRT